MKSQNLTPNEPLKIKTADSATSGTTTRKAEPITAVAEKVVMQDMEETGPRMAKAGPETVGNESKWQMLPQVWQKPNL